MYNVLEIVAIVSERTENKALRPVTTISKNARITVHIYY